MKPLFFIIRFFFVTSVLFSLKSIPVLSADVLIEYPNLKRNYRQAFKDLTNQNALSLKRRRLDLPNFDKENLNPQTTRLNAPASLLHPIHKKESDEERYHIDLGYACDFNRVSYSGIDFVGLVISNKRGFYQEFESEEWKIGQELSFKKYRTRAPGILTITKDVLPLELTVMLIRRQQSIPLLRRVIVDKHLPKPLLSTWKKWRKVKATFDINNSDIFDENGKVDKLKMLVTCSDPESIDFLHFVRKLPSFDNSPEDQTTSPIEDTKE